MARATYAPRRAMSEEEVTRIIPEALRGTPAEAMDAYLAAIDDVGGPSEWFIKHGGSAATLETLRARLLQVPPSTR